MQKRPFNVCTRIHTNNVQTIIKKTNTLLLLLININIDAVSAAAAAYKCSVCVSQFYNINIAQRADTPRIQQYIGLLINFLRFACTAACTNVTTNKDSSTVLCVQPPRDKIIMYLKCAYKRFRINVDELYALRTQK